MAVNRTRAATPAPTFSDLGLPQGLVDVLTAQGITAPFPIQQATMPDALAGRDVLGRGRTGSGKTYAFLLPLVARLMDSGTARRPKQPRALILAPTRELATQIHTALEPLARAAGLRTLTVFGGVKPNPQIQGLRNGIDVLVACPGRLEDHVRSGHCDLGAVEVTVLDEADHMADLGFLPGVKRLLDKTPSNGQRMLFSATLDAGVDVLVRRYLAKPVQHSVDSAQSPVTKMAHHVLHVDGRESRLDVITNLTAAPGRTVVFTRTKHGAKAMARQLNARGVRAVELHGNLAQNARVRNLAEFSEGRATALVATDIAARGIHVDDVSLVVHADPPVEHKAYLHRSGRTARAGAEGTVVTVMLDSQVGDVRDLTRKAGIKPTITRTTAEHPVLTQIAPGERTFGEKVTVSRGGSGSSGGGTRSEGGRSGGGRGRGRGSGGNASQGASANGSANGSANRSRGRSRGGASTAGGAGTGRATHSAASFSASRRGR